MSWNEAAMPDIGQTRKCQSLRTSRLLYGTTPVDFSVGVDETNCEYVKTNMF